MTSDGLPAEGIVAAFQFAELRQIRWQLGNQATSTVPFAEGAISGHVQWHFSHVRGNLAQVRDAPLIGLAEKRLACLCLNISCTYC
jgi:hypothetical protein